MPNNVGVHLGAWSWAIHGPGSHIPAADWDKLDLLRSAGVRSVKYLLYEGSPDTQYEDLWRLYQERKQRELVLRLMHGNALPAPAEHWARYRRRVQHALDLGYRVAVQAVNEPNLELADAMTPAQLGQWYAAFKETLDLPVELVSPPLAPYAPNTWSWWDGMRQAVAVSDSCGVHVYARDAQSLQGAYSLGWWAAQCPDRQLRVLECGSPTGTPAAARAATLPWLYGQLARSDRVSGFYPFILSSEDARHAEHWLTDQDITSLRQAAQGMTPTAPPATPPAAGLAGDYVLTVYGHEIPFSVRRA